MGKGVGEKVPGAEQVPGVFLWLSPTGGPSSEVGDPADDGVGVEEQDDAFPVDAVGGQPVAVGGGIERRPPEHLEAFSRPDPAGLDAGEPGEDACFGQSVDGADGDEPAARPVEEGAAVVRKVTRLDDERWQPGRARSHGCRLKERVELLAADLVVHLHRGLVKRGDVLCHRGGSDIDPTGGGDFAEGLDADVRYGATSFAVGSEEELRDGLL